MTEAYITTRPTLEPDTDQPDTIARIRELDRSIHHDPESFMHACRMAGGAAVEFMTSDKETPLKDYKKVEVIATKLGNFIGHTDIRSVAFDSESEDAVYDDDRAQAMSLRVQAAKSQQIKRGSKTEHRENPKARELRDNQSALLLFLYAQRTSQWKEQVINSHNGAA